MLSGQKQICRLGYAQLLTLSGYSDDMMGGCFGHAGLAGGRHGCWEGGGKYAEWAEVDM
jgi:hypothetical protein